MQLVRYQVVSGNEVLPTATVEVEVDGAARAPPPRWATGRWTPRSRPPTSRSGGERTLLELHTRAVTAGKDALAEVVVRVRRRGDGVHRPGREHRLHRGGAEGVPLRGRAARRAVEAAA